MLRVLVLVSLAIGCTREPLDSPPSPPRLPSVVPWLPKPAPPPAPRTIELSSAGLGIWRGTTGGWEYKVVVDVAARTITATDPDNTPRRRALDPDELGKLVAMANDARSEPAIAQGTATDYAERLDIFDGTSTFEVANAGPIRRPAAARLVAALSAAAQWQTR